MTDEEVIIRVYDDLVTGERVFLEEGNDLGFHFAEFQRGFSGDSIGFSAGISWRGVTPVEGLTYGINVNAYNYQFDSNESELFGNIKERAVRVQAGVAYVF